MKKPLLMIILLLASMVNMVGVSPVHASPGTTVSVDPSSTVDYTLLPIETPETIRPMADGTYTDWTNKTLTIRPNSDGTFTDWVGHYTHWDDTPDTPASNVDGRTTVTGWDNWTKTGASPWLDAPDYPTNYINSNVNSSRIGNFTFADVPLYSCPTLRIKTWRSALGDDHLKIYLNDGTTSWTTYTVIPTNTTAPGSYVEVDVFSFLSTLAKVNAAKMAIEHIVYGTADTIGVDHAYLSFTYVSATAGGLSESSNLQNHTSETWDIARVQVSIVARYSGATDEKVAIMLAAPPFTYGFNATVDGRTTVTGWTGWTQVGNSPWLDAADYPSHYIYSAAAPDKLGNFTFANAPTGIIWNTATVTLRIRTWQDGNDHLKIYLYNGTSWTSYTILPDITAAPGSYVDVDVSSFLNTKDKINAAKMALEHIKDGSVDTIGVDHAYLSVSATGVAWSGPSKKLSHLTYSTYSNTWTNNPCTGSAWSWSDIDALEAGVQSVQIGPWYHQIRVTQLYVVVLGQDGTYREWDEATQNGDTDYVSATTGYMKETSEMEDITSPPTWTIAKVRVVFYARATENTDGKVQPILVVGGISYPATLGPTEYIPTKSYAKYTGDWGVNPETGANWTWSDINLLQAGVQSVMEEHKLCPGEIRVTQLYVEVAGPRFTIRIMVEDVIDLQMWQVEIYYNPAILEVTGVSLPPNHVFAGHYYFFMAPLVVINNVEGYVSSFGVQMLDPWTFNGTGILGDIICRVIDRGVTPLYFSSPYGTETFLWDSEESLIPASTEDGFFGNTILGDVTGDGTVDASDLSDFSEAYGGPPLSKCNFNWDGKVDVLDLFDLSKNYGESIP